MIEGQLELNFGESTNKEWMYFLFGEEKREEKFDFSKWCIYKNKYDII